MQLSARRAGNNAMYVSMTMTPSVDTAHDDSLATLRHANRMMRCCEVSPPLEGCAIGLCCSAGQPDRGTSKHQDIGLLHKLM